MLYVNLLDVEVLTCIKTLEREVINFLKDFRTKGISRIRPI